MNLTKERLRQVVGALIRFAILNAPVTVLTAWLYHKWHPVIGIPLAIVSTSMIAQTILFLPNKIVTFKNRKVDAETIHRETLTYFKLAGKFCIPEVGLVWSSAHIAHLTPDWAWVAGHAVLSLVRFRKLYYLFRNGNGTPRSH